MGKRAYLLVNFGGPRDLQEIEEFLIELLTDQEVVRTSLPSFMHRWLFTRVAKKRTKKIAPDYELIGGKSPIFEDTQAIASQVSQLLQEEVITFHRYLPKTHEKFLKQLESLDQVTEIRVFPMFPQFSYATTGSIALWFDKHLSPATARKLSWVKSYPAHPSFVDAFEQCIREFLKEKNWKEDEIILLFSAHGLPVRFVSTGDIYEKECCLTFELLKERFPQALSQLSYQSQFGKEEWIRPYTAEVCAQINAWRKEREKVVVVPLSFTSDHIETLYEIEQLYLPLIRKNGIHADRCPALNHRKEWVDTIVQIFKEREGLNNLMLIRKK